ncbi:ABC transporter permease subunit [Rhodoplanes sp. TEM]|uniref:ABC transporter permease subunit n=1 Tax=Rhodoplanes tepidamans TaxID=200616 RepID=A0ABT5J4U5_RHOTP|nr:MULTISPECIES: ABC transporter permease subunit [Rhodoplanes]MDC7784666.1 ABC transporter permease subunit [Rhodoplanes tepidamans]MDC7982133.1 ABC transporter permease subunit [Rhodoplanes sp. TEM]MDQ0356135.1 putative spermidine/putrescine transport system permease protein [Rhodoplanes tepidamans]
MRITTLAAGLLTVLVAAFLVMPAVVSMVAGVSVSYARGVSECLTLDWIVEVWRLYADTIVRSIAIALATVAVTLLIGVPAAYALVRRGGRLARVAEEIVTLPLAVPGLALALALIITYGGVRDLRGSSAFIVIGHVLYTLPFMLRSVMAVLQSIDWRLLDEGAASLGASPWRRFVDVVLPNARPGILAGALTVVTLSIGEFNLTWMLHTPLTKTLPVGLADSYASMRLEIASAYTLVFFLMIVPLLVAMQMLSRIGARREARP